jgi:curved DNA-binding protein
VHDLYATLGVSRDASAPEIKRAYRKLASKLHPDKQQKKPGGANDKRFKEVTRAYEVLGDEKRRKLYDEFGDASLQTGFDPERARAARHFGGFGGFPGGDAAPVDFGDLFGGAAAGGGLGDMLGDLFRRTRHRPTSVGPGADVTTALKVGFADALQGTTLKLVPPRGGEPITVRIPPGASDGSRLRVRGKGEPGRGGGPRGDLILVIEVEPHKHFRRDGDDLHLELPISLKEAFHGAQVKIPTPQGEVKLTVPKGTQSGHKLRLRGKGVERKGRPAGDLYVRFLVLYPETSPALEGVINALPQGDDPRRDLVL